MRLSVRGRRMARPPRTMGSTLLAITAFATSLSKAIEFTPVPSPNLDLSNLGRIGIAGDFSGISLYEYEGQSGRQTNTDGSGSLLAQLPNGAIASIVSSDATISSMCTFTLSSGEMQGVIIGGNFTSLDGTESTAIALFNPNTTEVTPLDGIRGEVNAILCDQERDTVYVGGNFRGANSTNAIAWYGTEGWTNLPFAGFNGPVSAITKASNGHIIFGGSFTGLGNATAPSQPDGQIINLSTANISAENSASRDGFSNPNNIVCSDGSDEPGRTWLLQDATPGAWQADMGFRFEPTKLRVRNTHLDGRGTRTFRYIAIPDGGIMNFTYIDPGSGQNSSCTSECPLSDNAEVEFQDFHFVNSVGMSGFRLAISDWYGSGAGLAGIELFQENILSYAVAEFNEPTCQGIEFPSNATATGPWRQSPSLQSASGYLTAELTGDINSNSASVIFMPNIVEPGFYSVDMYTPGCIADNTCDTRGRVNITGRMSNGDADGSFETSIYQTNNFDKFDQIYFGFIDQTSEDFRPTITIAPLSGQNVDTLTIVAERVGFTLINSTGGLNGLFEFNPEEAVVNTSALLSSTINQLGASFDRNSAVTSLVETDDVIFIGGNFTSNDHENIVALGSDNRARSIGGGLNGQVTAMYTEAGNLYAGGEFTNTRDDEIDGLNFVGAYNIESNQWRALGAGVNGNVWRVVPLRVNLTGQDTETAIAISGSFSECQAFDDFEAVPVDGFAVWIPSQENWLQNLDGPVPSYSGVLTAALLDIPDSDPLYAGSVTSAQLGVDGAATLGENGLGRFSIDIQTASASSNLTRRDIPSAGDRSGVVTGHFYEENDRNLTILAGQFIVEADDSTIRNLVIIDGGDNDSVTGPGSEISSDSTIVTIALRGSLLYAGGSITGNVDGSDLGGIFTYDVESGSFGSSPPGVSGADGTVSAITIRPDTPEVYVGGSFTQAGALDCPGICVYDAEARQWNRPGNTVAGEVSSMLWAGSNRLIAGGDMLGNNTDEVYLAIFDAEEQAWTSFPSAESIPGPVHVITAASTEENEVWVAGARRNSNSVYVMKYDGEQWQTVEAALASGTRIQSLQVFTVTEDHDDTDILDSRHVLMLTGAIDIPEFGIASAAIFNGTTFQPYALTTSSRNGAGNIAKIFTQRDDFFTEEGGHMRVAFVILIGLAIALGLILLIVVAGIVLDRIRKRREGYTPAPTSMIDRGSGLHRIPPHELLESLGQGRPGAPHI
ncbi:cellular morphogenesis protein [Stachybotrys elegans]|uniref:Cellular morphogenesis protein n=1 Tax=Stachybotrys elegans TaxID=80388 RepID=A0A8K0WXV1_9HYPO|nr:cellular morphogenesis protein [Stachybotrys elegans]